MEVIDDGVGMSEEELEAVRSYTFKPKGHGIGLKNISEPVSYTHLDVYKRQMLH